MSPCRAVGLWRTVTMSPEQMEASIMLSPRHPEGEEAPLPHQLARQRVDVLHCFFREDQGSGRDPPQPGSSQDFGIGEVLSGVVGPVGNETGD